MIRAFVEGLTIDESSWSGEIRAKELPVPQPRSAGSSFEMVPGPRDEVLKRNQGREVEVVRVRFGARGRVMVAVGA